MPSAWSARREVQQREHGGGVAVHARLCDALPEPEENVKGRRRTPGLEVSERRSGNAQQRRHLGLGEPQVGADDGDAAPEQGCGVHDGTSGGGEGMRLRGSTRYLY